MIKLFPKTYLSLRGGTTRQSVDVAMVSNRTTTWNHGSIMRLPRRGAPRNDVSVKLQ